MAFIKEITLTGFRCYEGAQLSGLQPGPLVLYGPNGAGKTNILEAVSLLSPGRGLRGAKVGEIQRLIAAPPLTPPLAGGDSSAPFAGTRSSVPLAGGDSSFHPPASGGAGGGDMPPWSISAKLETLYGETQVGTGRDADKERRLVRINGAPAKGQNALAEYLACVWLTPQMDRLFIEAAGTRRRFLDRLVFAFDASHAGRITRYENALSQRARLLKEQERPDPAWLEGLEAGMAETGVAIAAARLDFAQRLQKACDRAAGAEEAFFPRARLQITGTIEELLARAPALEVEEMFRYQLRETRPRDAVAGGAATGPHRSDLAVRYAAKDMPADLCSTGEQKALLIGIILAHGRLIAAERGAPPLLLLDEVAAHLDEQRRAALYDLLLAMKAQVWLTGTDRSLFDALGPRGQYFAVRDSRIEAAAQEQAA